MLKTPTQILYIWYLRQPATIMKNIWLLMAIGIWLVVLVMVMLAVLFAGENEFLLIDEPTNHLDDNARNIVKDYLSKKKGFILIYYQILKESSRPARLHLN